MRCYALAAALLLMQGCALTPNEVRQSGVVQSFDRAAPQAQIADCLERRLRNLNGEISTFREVQAWGRVDVGARMEDYGTIALAEISAYDAGSRVFIYVHRQLFEGKEKQVANELMQGC